jgi:hypothetical protein
MTLPPLEQQLDRARASVFEYQRSASSNEQAQDGAWLARMLKEAENLLQRESLNPVLASELMRAFVASRPQEDSKASEDLELLLAMLMKRSGS